MTSSSDESTDKEEVPSKKKQQKKAKFCGAGKYKTAINKEWFNDDKYKGIFNH